MIRARLRMVFARLMKDGIIVGVICVACAVIIAAISKESGNLFVNLVFSLTIGGIAWLLIDGSRLLFWGTDVRPPRFAFFAIVLGAVPVAQFGGSMLAARMTGVGTVSLGELIAGPSNRMLLFTLIMTGAAAFILHHRDCRIRAEAEAAHEKARAETEARQALQAQLQLLQAQIEPHMLFNTLANLQGLIGIDPERAQLMLDQLIVYLRASLSSSRAERTTLGREFALMEAYLGLMSVRMGARLAYTFDLPEALREASVPPMLLQPMVENAIMHGLEPKVQGGHVLVSAACDGDNLVLSVADNGLGLAAGSAKAGTHLGVANTRARLAALFGAAATLTLEANSPAGAVARLVLPMERTCGNK